MFLSLSFNNPNGLAPEAVIVDQDRKASIRHPRWVQFFSLLAHRRLLNHEQGRVMLEELPALLAFGNRTPGQAGKYLVNSASEFPPVVSKFIRHHLHLSTVGPFYLEILAEGIRTDLSSLGKYISWIFNNSRQKKVANTVSWLDVERATTDFESWKSLTLTSRCLLKKGIEEIQPPHVCSSALNHIVRAEYIRVGSSRRHQRLVAAAKSQASGSIPEKLKITALANTISTEIWITSVNKRNLNSLLALNQTVIDLAERLPKANSDRQCLLAARYYFIVFVNLFLYGDAGNSSNLQKARELFKLVCEGEPPAIVPFDPGVIESIDLQVELIKRIRLHQTPNDEDLSRYREVVDNRSIAKVTSLSCAEWITSGYIQQKKFDRALEFSAEALIDHAFMFDSSIFRRLNSRRKSLMTNT